MLYFSPVWFGPRTRMQNMEGIWSTGSSYKVLRLCLSINCRSTFTPTLETDSICCSSTRGWKGHASTLRSTTSWRMILLRYSYLVKDGCFWCKMSIADTLRIHTFYSSILGLVTAFRRPTFIPFPHLLSTHIFPSTASLSPYPTSPGGVGSEASSGPAPAPAPSPAAHRQ